MNKEDERKLKVISEVVGWHGGTGNSSWIFEAAKATPNCNIMYSHVALARAWELKYIAWFVSVNKRTPKEDEFPHFFALGDIVYHSKYSILVPLIIDNSCLEFLIKP